MNLFKGSSNNHSDFIARSLLLWLWKHTKLYNIMLKPNFNKLYVEDRI